MRIVSTLLLTALSTAPTAHADTFKISLYDQNPGNLIQAKNCFDLLTCLPTRMSYVDHDQKRSHVWVNTDERTVRDVLETCALDQVGLQPVVRNETRNQPVVIAKSISSRAGFESAFPASYSPVKPAAALPPLYRKLEKLLRDGRYQFAYENIPEWIGLQKDYSAIRSAPELIPAGAAAAIDETTRLLKVAPEKDYGPYSLCYLVVSLRHEIDHLYQYSKNRSCGRLHSWNDHIARERSAYLNDVFNAHRLCPWPEEAKRVQDRKIYWFLVSYFNN